MKVNIFQLKEEDIVSYNLVKASWLQKAVRRGDIATAKAIAMLYINDGQIAGLLRKLQVFVTEDIGLGTPDAINIIRSYENPLDKIDIICQMQKNREVDRFLLASYKKDLLLKNEELYTEIKTLDQILGLADIWFNNKRLKINKVNLENFVLRLVEDKSSWIKNTCIALLDNYFNLSKNNAFGARTGLALIVLISLRNINPEQVELHLSGIEPKLIDIVDDYALDKHTPFGKILNRGEDFWLKEGSKVFPERQYPSQFMKDGSEKYPYSLTISIYY